MKCQTICPLVGNAIFKGTHALEAFREYIKTIPVKLLERTFIFKLGAKYGVWSGERKPVKFYFEEMDGRDGEMKRKYDTNDAGKRLDGKR